jgi:hypothetical protein
VAAGNDFFFFENLVRNFGVCSRNSRPFAGAATMKSDDISM